MVRAADSSRVDIGRVIHRGLHALGRNAGPYLLLALVLAGVPAFVAEYLTHESVGGGSSAELFSRYSLGGSLVMWLSGYLLQAAIVRSSIRELSGRPADVPRSLVNALTLLLPMFGVAVLSSMILLVGTLLLIVPGIILYIMLILSVPVLVEERRGIFGSMSRSAGLTRGSRWRIFGLLLLFVAFYLAISAVAGALSGAAAGVGDPAAVAALSAATVSTLTGLLIAVLLAALYVEVRTVKEGASVDSLASIFD